MWSNGSKGLSLLSGGSLGMTRRKVDLVTRQAYSYVKLQSYVVQKLYRECVHSVEDALMVDEPVRGNGRLNPHRTSSSGRKLSS